MNGMLSIFNQTQLRRTNPKAKGKKFKYNGIEDTILNHCELACVNVYAVRSQLFHHKGMSLGDAIAKVRTLPSHG